MWYIVINESSKELHPLKAIRLELALSQGEFADLLGVRPNTVSRWETGRREPEFTMTQVIAIDAALKVKGKRICEYVETPPAGGTAEGE